MDRFTRKELKQDKFAQEVTHTVEYVGEHRRQFVRYGSVALALTVAAAGYFYYSKQQAAVRQAALFEATRIMDAPVGPPADREAGPVFATEAERSKASIKAFSEIASKYPGSEEGAIADYFLGTIALDQGRLDDASKYLKEVADSGRTNYASLAQLTLASIYQSQGKVPEAEKLLRVLMEKPTVFVSKQQATIALAELLAPSKPEEARKLLEPLRTERGAASRVALEALSRLPKK